MRTSYWVKVTTEDSYPARDDSAGNLDYAHVAALLYGVLNEILGSQDTMRTLTAKSGNPNDSVITHAHSEVWIEQLHKSPHSPVIARCLVDLDAPRAVSLHKPRLTSLVRSKLPYAVKVQKQFAAKDSIVEDPA